MADNLEKSSAFMDKYSRQIGAFGIETMAKLIKMKVLIVGLKGVGIECAKNLILAGPGAVTLYDDEVAEIKDLGSNFFLTEEDVGKPRASCVGTKLAELNKMVTVSVHTGDLTEELVGQHTVVVFTNTKRDELIRWNEFCRVQSPAIGFILCDIRGAFGYAFTDFGDHFINHDATGEAPITRIITDISNEKDGVISLLGPDEDGKMHEMPDSDHDGWVEISEVDGMKNTQNESQTVNTMGPYRIKFCQKKIMRNNKEVSVFDPYRLIIGDTTNFTSYEGGGVLTQHKKPYAIAFRSLKKTLVHPISPGDFGLMFTDGAKFGRGEQIHMAVWGILEFEQRHNRLPRTHSVEDADEVLRYAREGPTLDDDDDEEDAFRVEELDEDIVRMASMYADVELHPMAAFFGGVVAQEVVKFTGKFTPLNQWMHIDAFEVLPEKENLPTDTQPIGSRYDNIISVFGQSFQKDLGNVRTFLVGCGALGCEYLKNFAMIGLACGEQGLVTVTDNDRIEVSNLNRQFLFREHNVGQPKSVAATNAVKLMNNQLKVKAMEHLVAPNTEHIFHDNFWSSLDIITNALDNVKARLYVDSKCVFHKKPLLESGTLGTKCNVQVVVPDITQSYADGPKDAEDDNIPMCTLRNFPSLIEHCIEWARAQFEDDFCVPFTDAKKFVENPKLYLENVRRTTLLSKKRNSSAISQELDRLRNLKDILNRCNSITFDGCIRLATEMFLRNFRDRILQLIHNFPENHVTNAGEKFWSGAKRFPQAALSIDMANDYQKNFIIATANILAVCYGLQSPPEESLVGEDSEFRDVQIFEQSLAHIALPQWQPSNVVIAVDDAELRKQEEEAAKKKEEDPNADEEDLKVVLNELENMDIAMLNFEPADFEKDQDLNFHIDFIYAASNLRAWNYKIRQATRHKCKMIAGKIIPAIATTTASVTGLAMLEMLKVLQKKQLSSYKDSSNSLGLNMYLMQEPAPPEKAQDEYDVIEMSEVKCRPSGFTKWDRTIINAPTNITMGGFLERFRKETELNCDLLFHHIAELGDSSEVSGLMLYDRNAFNKSLKELYASKLTEPLIEWVGERYQNLVKCDASHIELQTSCTDDNGDSYKVPSVVLKFN